MNAIRYNLKNPKSTDETLIFLIFRWNSQKLKVSTQLTIDPKFWNFEEQRIKKSFKNSKLFNDLLEAYEVKLNKLMLQKKLAGQRCDMDMLKAELFGQEKPIKRRDSLRGFYEEYISNKRPVWSRSTFNSYNRTFELLSEFMEADRVKDEFDSVNLNFYNRFLTWLYSEPRSFSVNNAGKIIQNLKAVLNSAVSEGVNTNLKFKNKNFSKPVQSTTHIYLNMEELNTLYKTEYTNNTFERVRDILLVLCYTGLRYSDVYKVTQKSIKVVSAQGKKVHILEILTTKTGTLISVPVHPVVNEILQKYDFVLPQYSNQKLNFYLKEVAKIAGISGIVSITTSVAGKPIILTKPKFEFVCSHIGRRTLITNMYLQQIDSHSIRMISGHTSEKEFQKYIKVSLEQNSITLSKHPFFDYPPPTKRPD